MSKHTVPAGKFRPVFTTDEASIPKDFVLESTLQQMMRYPVMASNPLNDDMRLYKNAKTYAKQGRIPSYELKSVKTGGTLRVYLPQNWREQALQVMAAYEGFTKIKRVSAARSMAMSMPVKAPEPTFHKVEKFKDPLPPAPGVRPGIDLLVEMVKLQRETLAAMQRLERIWAQP